MPDLWAFCEPCARWFYCARAERDSAMVCPACGVSARVRREGRPEHPQAVSGAAVGEGQPGPEV